MYFYLFIEIVSYEIQNQTFTGLQLESNSRVEFISLWEGFCNSIFFSEGGLGILAMTGLNFMLLQYQTPLLKIVPPCCGLSWFPLLCSGWQLPGRKAVQGHA